jgi:hypothetical protein
MKMMSSICDKKQWTAYVGVVIKSEIYGIEFVVIKVAWNNVADESSRLSTLPEAVDEHHVECGVVFIQSSQETQADIDTEEPPFVASNKTVYAVEPVCGSVGDGVTDIEFISGVDPQPISIGFALDVDISFAKPEFIPEYEATFGMSMQRT